MLIIQTERCRLLWVGSDEGFNPKKGDDESHEIDGILDSVVHHGNRNLMQMLVPSTEESRKEVYGCIHLWGLRRPRWPHRIRLFFQNTLRRCCPRYSELPIDHVR